MIPPHFDVRVLSSPANGGEWIISIDNYPGSVDITFEGKDDCERAAACVASALAHVTEGTAELYVHNRDGTYEEGGSRRTYPRSADPSESPG